MLRTASGVHDKPPLAFPTHPLVCTLLYYWPCCIADPLLTLVVQFANIGTYVATPLNLNFKLAILNVPLSMTTREPLLKAIINLCTIAGKLGKGTVGSLRGLSKCSLFGMLLQTEDA